MLNIEEKRDYPKPSKLRVPGSIPGAPTTNSLKTKDDATDGPPFERDGISAFSGLSGAFLRNNCGSDSPPERRKYGSGSLRQKGGLWYARARLAGGKQIERAFGNRKDLAEEFLIRQKGVRAKGKKWATRELREFIERYNPEDYPDGNIYMVRAAEYVKVGFTTDVNQRMQSFVSHCPFEVSILFCVPGSVKLERELHHHLQSVHVRAEWFAYSRIVRSVAAAFAAPELQSQELKRQRKTAVKPWAKGGAA